MKRKFIVAAAAVMTMVLGGYVGAAGAVTETRGVTKALFRDGYDTSTAEGYSHPFLWYREDTRTGGGVGLTNPDRTDEPCVGAPEGFGNQALALATNSSGAAKAQLINHSDEVVGTPLSTVNELSYWTYQCAGTGTASDNASYQLQVDLDGDLATTGDRTNLVYETYWNDTEGSAPQQPLEQGVWQHWAATEGDWWASRQITCGEYSLAPGAGGPPFDQPQDVGEACPSAVVFGVGVNVGSGNANHIVAVDGLTFGSTADTITWDFGPAPK